MTFRGHLDRRSFAPGVRSQNEPSWGRPFRQLPRFFTCSLSRWRSRPYLPMISACYP